MPGRDENLSGSLEYPTRRSHRDKRSVRARDERAGAQMLLSLSPATRGRSFNFSTVLGDFINANEASILTETHTVPLSFAGQPFLTGSVVNDPSTTCDDSTAICTS
jgi:hypothetical protein